MSSRPMAAPLPRRGRLTSQAVIEKWEALKAQERDGSGTPGRRS